MTGGFADGLISNLRGFSGLLDRKIILAFLGLLIAVSSAAANDVTGCMEITQPGYYVLQNDLGCSGSICIQIESSDVILDGNNHKITGCSNDAIRVGYYSKRTNVTVKNLKIEACKYGIELIDVENSKIENVSVKVGYHGRGINIAGAQYATVTGNTITGAGSYSYGIYITSDHNNVTGNTIRNCYYGIQIYNSNYNTVADNVLEDNFNDGFVMYGSSTNNEIRGNMIEGNTYGIFLSSSGTSDNTITQNTIQDNRNYGIFISYYTGTNTIYNNYFNNSVNFYIVSTTPSIWNMTKTPGLNIVGGSYLGGNYWAKPDGTGFSQTCDDSDGDGICDSKYTLDSQNMDYLPLAKPNNPAPIPEFPTPVLPAVMVITLLLLFGLREREG